MNWCNNCTRWIQLSFVTMSCHENYPFRRSLSRDCGSWSSGPLLHRLESTCRCFCVTTFTAIFLRTQSGGSDEIAGWVPRDGTLIKGASGRCKFPREAARSSWSSKQRTTSSERQNKIGNVACSSHQMNAPVHNNKVQLVNIRQNVGSYEIYKRHVFFSFIWGWFLQPCHRKKRKAPKV